MTTSDTLYTRTLAATGREERAKKISDTIFLTGLGPCLAALSTLTPEAAGVLVGAVLGATVATRVPVAAYSLVECAFRGGLAGILVGGYPYASATQTLSKEHLPQAAVSDFVLTTCPFELTTGRVWGAVPEQQNALKSFAMTVKGLSTVDGQTTVKLTVNAAYKNLLTGTPAKDSPVDIDVSLPPKYDGTRSTCFPALPRALNGFIFKPA